MKQTIWRLNRILDIPRKKTVKMRREISQKHYTPERKTYDKMIHVNRSEYAELINGRLALSGDILARLSFNITGKNVYQQLVSDDILLYTTLDISVLTLITLLTLSYYQKESNISFVELFFCRISMINWSFVVFNIMYLMNH